MMEAEILKFICANQGSVNTDYLLFNLAFGDSVNVSETICNQEKFASCCPFGQPKVVARTNLRLCRARDCQGTCRGLHLCKNILFTGSCQFSRSRYVCLFKLRGLKCVVKWPVCLRLLGQGRQQERAVRLSELSKLF